MADFVKKAEKAAKRAAKKSLKNNAAPQQYAAYGYGNANQQQYGAYPQGQQWYQPPSFVAVPQPHYFPAPVPAYPYQPQLNQFYGLQSGLVANGQQRDANPYFGSGANYYGVQPRPQHVAAPVAAPPVYGFNQPYKQHHHVHRHYGGFDDDSDDDYEIAQGQAYGAPAYNGLHRHVRHHHGHANYY